MRPATAGGRATRSSFGNADEDDAGRTRPELIILIADDHAEMRRTIRSVVHDLASVVHECADGAAALTACLEQRPDWVLMDIEMRGMDGLEATRAIRQACPGVRVCIVSNHDDVRLREAARAAGACAYVHKEELLALRTILSIRTST